MTLPGLCRHRRPRAAFPAVIAAALVLAVAWQAVALVAADPQPTAKGLYESAQARERTIRAALDASPPEPPPTRDAMRQAVAAYRQVVLRFPKSGYCDNAIWLAAQLSADTFARHGDERDRQVALQLLASLGTEYPASPFVARLKAERARVNALAPAAAAAKPAEAVAAAKPAVAPPAAPPETVLVRDVRHRATATTAVVEIELEGQVQFREERLYNPSRVFFDLPKTRTTDALRDATLAFDAGPIRQIRVGRHPNSMTRIVMDTAEDARCVAQLAPAPYRLVVTCGREAAPGQAAAPGSGRARRAGAGHANRPASGPVRRRGRHRAPQAAPHRRPRRRRPTAEAASRWPGSSACAWGASSSTRATAAAIQAHRVRATPKRG